MKSVFCRSSRNWHQYGRRTTTKSSTLSLLQTKFLSFHSDRENEINNCDKNNENTFNPLSLFALDRNKKFLNCHSTTSVAAASAAAATVGAGNSVSGLVTTAGGYALAPLAITLLSNAPLVAFALVQASGIAPIRQILADKKTGDLSPFSFVSLYTNCAIWTLYGVLGGDQTILIANAAGVVAGVVYTGIFAKNTDISMMPYYLGSVSIMGALLSSPFWMNSTENTIQLLGSFGCASAVILMASPLSVVSTVFKNQSTDAMPLPVSIAMTLNGAAWGTYGWVVANDPYIYLPNVLGCAAGFIQLGLHAKFRGKSNENKNEKQSEQPQIKYSRHDK